MVHDAFRPFHIICDASNFATGYALMQVDDESQGRVMSLQSRQKKPAIKKLLVQDKERLNMRYALIKFKVY